MAFSASIRTRLAVTVSLGALLLSAAPALAQATPDEPTVVDDIIVTAQRREESAQDVPIAVSAFSAEALDNMKIDGGPELVRAIPNVSFSKSNFSMYNFSIRGVGTKAISAGSDPAVAVSFNNTPVLRNRLFEQEYLDVARVEVLRGPQGTLYGRNATAGVVNMIPALPEPGFEASVKGELGNYNSIRGSGMINVPLTDTLWFRAAGSFTKRDGFDYNSFNKTEVNDRDLWSTRLSVAWEPTDRFRTNLIWEHFEEDDNRSRTGKQLCTRDPGPAQVGSTTVPNSLLQARMSQGCSAGSLYSSDAYGVPNGAGLSQIYIASQISYGRHPTTGDIVYAVNEQLDPYAGLSQSRDLRTIATSYDPVFRAKNDVAQLNIEFDITEGLTFYSQTLYAKDDYYSSQDYARYVSNPIFNDSTNVVDIFNAPSPSLAAPGGIYTDPQLGASDRMLSVDLSRSDNRQWSQEFRLQSSWDGPFNFSLGANYLDFESRDDYFVFNNVFSLIGEYFYNVDLASPFIRQKTLCESSATRECIYVDPSPLNKLQGDGHNYFRSKNEVHTRSWAIFGEGYFDLSPELRMTVGLRYTDDEKTATPYPSQLLLGTWDLLGFGPSSGGSVSRGYPPLPDIEQGWTAWTGRFVLDWKPELSFTDNTLLYASYARGYKGGGANPPRADINTAVVQYQPLPETFEPEYVNAFEIGTKNSLFDDTLRLNVTAFYYDYKDYQVSQIVDRIALNENFDAKSMGLEIETVWRPTPDFRLDANFGFLKTEIGDGESSIDVMNRTQGNDDWVVLRPWMQVPSNCVAPRQHVETILASPMAAVFGVQALSALCGGALRVGSFDPAFPSNYPWHAVFGFTYNPLTDAPNGGRGFAADLSGNELPNAPRFTANIGAQYTFHLNDWDLTARGDYYRQSSSYFRVYNTTYDRLKGWDNLNLSVTLESPDKNLVFQAYVKNVFDDAPIVDAFTNSDDSMLTTNVFTLDPRLIGVSVTGRF
jgi:iron complex outermembrane receptor protein